MRQRNIPTNDKVSFEVQTDINLVHQPLLFDSRIVSHLQTQNVSHLLRGQTDYELLEFFRQQANFFKGLGSLENVPAVEMRKRLLWIEQQIQGLQKRQLVVNGLEQSDYYSVVSDLQGRLDKQFVINNNYEPKLRQAQMRIDELEKEIQSLRRSVIQQQNYKVQCELYEEAFKKVSQVTRDQRRMREIQKTVNQTLIPLLNEYEIKIENMNKNLSNLGRATNDPKYKLKGHITGLLRNFDKIIKSTGEMTLENVEKYISQFLRELEVSSTYELYEESKGYKQRYIDLERRYNASVSMFKNKFDYLLEQNPAIRSQLDLSIFDVLQREGISFYHFDKVITIEGVGHGYRTAYYQSEERTKKLLGLLVGQFKGLLNRFPLLREQLSGQLLEVLSLEIFEDAIALEEIERIFEVVKYRTDIVKVENVYTYNNEAHLKTIFHLKIMIATLLAELEKVKVKTGITLEIDEGLLGMIRAQILAYINVDDVLSVFRTCPKILEVEKIVERNLTRYQGTLTEAHPVVVQTLRLAETVIEKPVILKEQVGVVIEKGVPLIAVHEKPIEIRVDRVIEVPVEKEVIVERTIFDERFIEVDVVKEVGLIREQIKIVQVPVTQQLITQETQFVTVQVPVVTRDVIKEIVEVQRLEERLVEVVREVSNIREVKVIEQVPIEIHKYIEVEKVINNFVNVPQVIEVKEQIPIHITNTIEKPVEIIETVEKLVQVRSIEEKILEVPVEKQIVLIQEVAKPFRETDTVFIKGDREEIIVEIEKIYEKPLIQEVLVARQVERQKLVPLMVKQQIPVVVEVNQPYIQNEVEIVTLEIEKVVPYKEEIAFEVVKEIPVPIICEKEVLKPVRVIVEKVVETMVEVPRVVEVQKIVEKIVVVPRIVEKVVLVPQIVEKIVEREVQVLKIIEVEVPVPYYITKQVQQIVQERVQVPVERIRYETIEREKLLVTNTETQILKEVEVERRIPFEVIREREVPFIQERLVEKVLTVNNVEIREKEVVLPMRIEVPVEIIQERAVDVKKVVETLVQVPQIVTKNVILYETRTVPEIHEIIVEKPYETIKQVVYTDIHNVIETKPEYRDLIKEVIVKDIERIEIIKPEPYFIEKIVTVTNIEQEVVGIKIEKGVPYQVDKMVLVETPVPVALIQEVPKVVNVEKVVELRSIHETIKEVPVEGREKIVTLETIRPEIIEVSKQVVKVLIEHQEKDVYQQVAVLQENTQIIEVPSKPIIVHEVKEIYTENTEILLMEKIIERITLLPQIVEVLKHVHTITEERIDGLGLGIAELGIDIQVHTSNYISLCTNLRKGLEGLLISIRNAKAPEVKTQAVLIEELVVILSDLIRFPNIVQIPKVIEKIVEVERPVVVPTRDTLSINRQIAANTLIEKLLFELKRIRKTGIEIKLEQDILNTFMIDTSGIDNLKDKLGEYGLVVVNKFKSLGEWTEQHSLTLNSFLEERFLMAGLVKESNRTIERLRNKINLSEASRKQLDDAITKLNILNLSLKNSLDDVVESLVKATRSEVNTKQYIETVILRVKSTLDLVDSQSIDSRLTVYASEDNEKLRRELSELHREVESYRGGEAQRTKYLEQQNRELRVQLDAARLESSRLKISINESYVQENSRERILMTTRVEDLNRLLTDQKQDYDRTVLKLKEEFEKRLLERVGEGRVITSTLDRSEQEEKLRATIKQLELRIRELEQELANTKNRESRMTADMERRTIEYQDLKKKYTERDTLTTEADEGLRLTIRDQESKIKELRDNLGKSTNELSKSSAYVNRIKGELEKSELEQSRLHNQLKRRAEEIEGMRVKLSESQVIRSGSQKGVITSTFTSEKKTTSQTQNEDTFKSPELKESKDFSRSNSGTPADQLRGIGTSPEVAEYQFSESSGTDKKNLANIEYKNLTIGQLIKDGNGLNENISAQIIVKVCQKLQSNTKMKLFLFYTPSNIRLVDYSPDDLSKLNIELGAPIKIKEATEAEKLYLSPEALIHSNLSEKSCVFNVGMIWDEMIHGSTFFKSSGDIESTNVEFKIRNNKLNPIFKNALFEMVAKEPTKRQEFAEIKRRLSLQRFITSDDKKKQ